jgi:hypothetical protein
MALVDMDGDQDLDLVTASNGGPVRFFLNQGGIFTDDSVNRLPDQKAANVPTLLVRDIDGDCSPDLLFVRDGNDPLIWYNDGSGKLKDRGPVLKNILANGGSVTGAAVDDVDGDGLVDLLFYGPDGLSLWLQQ